LTKPIRWILCDPVDPSGHALQPTALCEPNQDGVFDSQSAGISRQEQAAMLFGKFIELVHASARHN
jgi:hypothetical protein